MTEPTDAELDELRQANSGRLNFVTFSEFRTIARAALAKWGTPQQEAQEPVMIYHGDCTIDCGEHGHHHVELLRMIPAGSKLYTAPQPSPTPQADSQPAGADRHGLPPLPDPDLRDVGTTPRDIKEFLRGYATEYALTALATPQPTQAQAVACEPDFYTACAWYEDGGEAGWIPLPGYSNETEHGVQNLVLQAARKEGYKGTVTGRLQELGWEIRPVYLAPQSSLQQPVAGVKVVHQFRKKHCADWYDGFADHSDGGGPYEERTLYTAGAVPLTHDEALDAFCHTTGIHQFVQAFMAGVRFAEHHHGIKGGQHGAEY